MILRADSVDSGSRRERDKLHAAVGTHADHDQQAQLVLLQPDVDVVGVGPGRGAGVSTSPFPRAARRSNASGLPEGAVATDSTQVHLLAAATTVTNLYSAMSTSARRPTRSPCSPR
jgi:hypothetical protein